MSLGAEEGRITGSFESGNEAYSSKKCKKKLTKLMDSQNHMGAPSLMELVNDRSLNLLTNTIMRTSLLLYFLRRSSLGPAQPPIQSVL
jgi:hypothetical protein